MDLLDKIIRHSGPQNILLVGVRNYPENVSSLIARHHIKSYTMREISFEGLHETCDAVMAASRTFKNLCVCIDLRVLDPAFAPGIISEPGGLTTRELIYFMQRLRLLKNLRLGILFNDMHDSSPELVILAAKILAELAPG
jgi:arginase family enzyme